MKNNPVRMRAVEESFLLMNPNPSKNSHEVARKMAACSGVKRVVMAKGDFGFVVLTSHNSDQHTRRMRKAMRRVSGSRVTKVAIGHFAYATK